MAGTRAFFAVALSCSVSVCCCCSPSSRCCCCCCSCSCCSSRAERGVAKAAIRKAAARDHVRMRRGIVNSFSSAIRRLPDGIKGAEGVLDEARELRAFVQNLRVVGLVEEQPASDEDPLLRGGVTAIDQPLDGALRQHVARRAMIRVLDESGVARHPSCQLALPRFLDRLLEPLEQP